MRKLSFVIFKIKETENRQYYLVTKGIGFRSRYIMIQIMALLLTLASLFI